MRLLLSATVIAATTAYGIEVRAEPWLPDDPTHPWYQHSGDMEVAVLHAGALMTTMRVAEAAIWPEPFAESSPYAWGAAYGQALTEPPRWDPSLDAFEWDGDDWKINVLGHGLFGSELYVRARMCRAHLPGAFIFAAASSATWEYVFEGNAVQPSGLDLWFTPVAGMVVGELRFLGWYGAQTIEHPVLRQVLSTAMDPFGELERVIGSPC